MWQKKFFTMISEDTKNYEFRETISHTIMYRTKCLHAVQWSTNGVNQGLGPNIHFGIKCK